MTDYDYNEFENFVNLNPNLKPLTAKTYYNTYKNIRKHLKDISPLSENKLIKYIDNFENTKSWQDDIPPSTNTLLNTLNVIIQIKRSFDEENFKLIKKRNELMELRDAEKENKINMMVLPTKKEVNNYIKTLYKKDDNLNYIINFLIFNYFLTAQDLNIAIVEKITDTKNHLYNYLVISKSHVNFVKYGNKSSDKFGRKSFSIKSKPFKIALNKLIAERNDENKIKYLITTKENKPLDKNILSKYIKNKLYDFLSPQLYHRINIMDIINNNNVEQFKQAADRFDMTYNALIEKYNMVK